MTVPNPPDSPSSPTSTASPLTRVLGLLTLASAGLLVLYGLVLSPADAVQRDAVRLMYVHVPSAIGMELGTVICGVASALWLRKRTTGWDALAHAAAEVTTLFTGLTLATGMIWGRPTWGVYWTWDARLTSTALLFVLLLGYLALRRLPDPPEVRNRRAAVVGLLLVPNAIIVKYSVDWWLTLHQGATISRADATIEDLLLVSLMVGMVTGLLAFAWLLVHRFRLAWLEAKVEDQGLETAIAARRAEAIGHEVPA